MLDLLKLTLRGLVRYLKSDLGQSVIVSNFRGSRDITLSYLGTGRILLDVYLRNGEVSLRLLEI